MDVLPPPLQMVQMLAGFQVSQALYAAAKLGVPDQLTAGPKHIDDIAAVLNVDRSALGRLARTLSGIGVFSEVGEGRYELTPLGATLTSDQPGSMRDLALMWMETHYAPFAGLVETVRTGHCAAEVYYGVPFFDWLVGQPEQIARFSGAMANLTDGIKVAAIDTYDFSGARQILDVGGADGTLLARVLQRVPEASGVAFDLPHVVPAVSVVAKEANVADRLTAEAGDFFERVPAGFDTYLLSMVLHDWDDERAIRLLHNIASAGGPGARVRALELLVPAGNEPHLAKMIDLTMLAMLTGKERTEPEYAAIFEAAGLRFERAVGTPTPLSMIEGSVPDR